MKNFLAIFFSLASITCNAQTKKIAGIFIMEKNARSAEERLDAMLALFEEYQSLNRDTLYNLALEAKQIAAKQPNQGKKALAALGLANAYLQWGWIDSALATIEPALANSKAYPKNIYFKIARSKAIYYGARSELEKALSLLFPALTDAEKAKDTLNSAAIMNSIGSISIERGKLNDAINWVMKSIFLAATQPKYKIILAASYTNAANAYYKKKVIDSAFHFADLAVSTSKAVENLFILANALRIRSALLCEKKDFAGAEAALKEMIAIRKLTGGDEFFIEDNLQLADFYANTGQLGKAIALCKKHLKIGNLYDTSGASGIVFANEPKIRLEYFKALSRYYKQANQYREYEKALEEIISLKDSFYTANSVQAIADAQEKYNTQKKENTILQQKYSLERNHFFLYSSFVYTTLLLLIAFLLFRDYRRKQKSILEIAVAEVKKNAAIAVKEAEEKERVRIAADLHDNLGAYAASMSANLGYLHPKGSDEQSNQALLELQNNSSSIISELNDTIWVLKKESLSLTAISDRVKLFTNRIRRSHPQTAIEVIENISTDFDFPASQAFHLYRIIQEALTNALKHSNADNIVVQIHAAQSWDVIVEDNGIGMTNSANHKTTGNGLLNMQQRARESGWNIHWKTNGSKGTAIIISPNTN